MNHPCPNCRGEGHYRAFVECTDTNKSGLRSVMCRDCNGTGTITSERLTWMVRGNSLVEVMRKNGITLRRGAEDLGISLTALSDARTGRVDPTDILTRMTALVTPRPA